MVPTARTAQALVHGISLATLRVAVRALYDEHPDRVRLLRQAAQLVALQIVEPDPDGGWWVQSARGADYHVVDGHCPCPACARQGGACAHVLAVELFRRCEQAAATAKEAHDALRIA